MDDGEDKCGRCIFCQRIGRGKKDFICEDCGHPEKSMVVCRCGMRKDLTLLSPETISEFFNQFCQVFDLWTTTTTHVIAKGVTISVPACPDCFHKDRKVTGDVLIYRVRQPRVEGKQ